MGYCKFAEKSANAVSQKVKVPVDKCAPFQYNISCKQIRRDKLAGGGGRQKSAPLPGARSAGRELRGLLHWHTAESLWGLTR